MHLVAVVDVLVAAAAAATAAVLGSRREKGLLVVDTNFVHSSVREKLSE